ncbi:YggS family pyridoxal phosphate-dependent enzyme [Aneurinibacillus sp. REN35]|uniref:YggS family pyridoxal phosphate-dependent enzyme n=1 Tax=Aneurinibacillus sp. REN35 TaxID=3237286 RepID=UPI0035294804
MAYIEENLQQIQATIQASCERAGRSAADVHIVAVTKYVSLETTRAALTAGIRHIGESRTQDALPKWEAIGAEVATWHFIGHLQTNKVREMIGRFTYVHSLDRLSLAKELNKRGEQNGITTHCMVQVNISGEETKHGLAPEAVSDFLAAVCDMPHIDVCGFMTMAPYVEDPEETRSVFRGLRELRDRMRSQYPDLPLKHLSMGMSNDYHIAVEEGATFIRLGSTLVGDERN